jgi:hypothetical protein
MVTHTMGEVLHSKQHGATLTNGPCKEFLCGLSSYFVPVTTMVQGRLLDVDNMREGVG